MYVNNAYFGAQCIQIGPTLGYLEPQGMLHVHVESRVLLQLKSWKKDFCANKERRKNMSMNAEPRCAHQDVGFACMQCS